MTIKQITKLQSKNGLTEMQDMINSGLAWHMEGTIGRMAMDYLNAGVCYLPKEPRKDYWGNTIPGRDMLKPGTKGTLLNSQNYWNDNIPDSN